MPAEEKRHISDPDSKLGVIIFRSHADYVQTVTVKILIFGEVERDWQPRFTVSMQKQLSVSSQLKIGQRH